MILASRMRVFDVLFARWLGNAGIFSLHSIIFWSTQKFLAIRKFYI